MPFQEPITEHAPPVRPLPDADPAPLGHGVAVPAELRTRAEAAMGLDLAAVRLHDGPAADAVAQRFHARALTVGTDIAFHRGFYRPDTRAGRRLIAHELAHVGQQARGGPTAAPAHESAADRAAAVIVGDRPGPVAVRGAAVGVQREPLGLRDAHTGLKVSPLTIVTVIDNEVADIEAVTARLAADVPLHPKAHALNAVRYHAQRITGEQQAVVQLKDWDGEVGAHARAAEPRLAAAARVFAPVVALAERWHADNPAGQSLGMWNEEQGTWLAGQGLKNWEKGGWNRVTAVGAFIGLGGVAVLDAGETMLSFGFHEAATAVSQAYTRGDISWDTGEDILWRAAWRALLAAAITATAGYGAGRLGATAAQALRLAPEAAWVGTGIGAFSGGVSSAAGLATLAGLTVAWRDSFTNATARAIFAQALPSGRDWAIAIPLGMLLGGLGGAKSAADLRAKMVGTIVDTPAGKSRIVAVLDDGRAVLEDAAGRLKPTPPPPPGDIVMVLDPETGVWRVPQGGVPLSAAAPSRSALVKPAPARPRPQSIPERRPLPQLPPPRPRLPEGELPATTPDIEQAQLVEPPLGGTGVDRPVAPEAPAPPREHARSAPVEAAPDLTGPFAATTAPISSTATAPLAPVPSALVVTTPAVEPATPVGPVAAPSAAVPPTPTQARSVAASANVATAEQRMAETGQALSRAVADTAAARARLAAAEADAAAARQLLAEHSGSAETTVWAKEAAEIVAKRRSELAALTRSEAWATQEAADAVRARAAIDALERELLRLRRAITLELNPPGGFTREQIWEGRRPGVAPLPERSLQPSAAGYHTLSAQERAAQTMLSDELSGLGRSIRDRVAAAVPGPNARPVALANAEKLANPLRPVDGKPIDIATGKPITTMDWPVDHIMSRTEIAADPRFPRLTPLQQIDMLRNIPENYLPVVLEVNSSKGGLSITEWLARRNASGRPIPPDVELALRAADVRARSAVEARFRLFLGE